TAAHYASMYADLQRGKRTEIDSLNGAVVRLGEEKGLATPLNLLLTRLVQAREWLAPKAA
ncbi:MAG: ketopantoate reductase C-terminal domain-containing protein, partial [Dehalococcoidia bacterium]|nr:ketopantoate reductase C-terminal domain-containing protein [Dehalococcoidia bacterium]